MKKFILFIALIIGMQQFCFSQPGLGKANQAEVFKMAYITRELNLTTDEAQKFWPVYNSYIDEIKKTRMENKGGDEIVFEEKILGIKKKYSESFKKILGTDERVNNLFKAERNMVNLFRKELQKRQQMKALRQNNRPQNQ